MKVWSKRTWVCVKTAVQAWRLCMFESRDCVYSWESANRSSATGLSGIRAKQWLNTGKSPPHSPLKKYTLPNNPKGVQVDSGSSFKVCAIIFLTRQVNCKPDCLGNVIVHLSSTNCTNLCIINVQFELCTEVKKSWNINNIPERRRDKLVWP